MAVQKLNVKKNIEKDVASSAKGTISTKGTITGKLGRDNIEKLVTGRFEKVSIEPTVDFINSFKLDKKTFVNCTVKADVMSWRLTDGIIGRSRNEIIESLRSLGERLNGIEVRDRINADLVIREFKSFSVSFIRNVGGLTAEVNPDGTIDIIYLGESRVVSSDIRPNLSKSDFTHLSYVLRRKEKNGSKWVDIASGESWGVIKVKDAVSLTLNTQYTYHLSLKNLNTNNTIEHDADILYKALDVKIVEFTAEPDPIERKVNLRHDVKNYTEIRVVRKDTNKELERCNVDSDVVAGKKYSYVLYASNAWYKNVEAETVADCTNVKPNAGKLS